MSSFRNSPISPDFIRWLEYPTLANPKHLVYEAYAPSFLFYYVYMSCSTHYAIVMNLGGS